MTVSAALTALADKFGEQLRTSQSERDQHGGSETHFNPIAPDAVFYPNSTADVAAAVTICQKYKCPVIPYGTGTSLEGHTLAILGGVSFDFSHMNKVLAVNCEDFDVVVQPGLTRRALNAELRATGLFFPVDPGANASVGGMAATRASGTTTVRYGNMAENVLALEVVLADGRIIRTGSRARKSSTGYDLTKLMVGSEGTLGVITELTLRLHGRPEATAAAICAFDDVADAVDAVIAGIQSGVPTARIELVDSEATRAFNLYGNTDMPEKPHVLLEFHGSHTAVDEQARLFRKIAKDFGASNFEFATKPEDRDALWTLRHNAYYATLALRKGATAVVTDICVPISKLAQAIDETRKDIANSDIPGPILGHVGDGNFHAILLIDPDKPTEKDTALKLGHRMAQRALRLGGTISGEHGIGVGKLDLMADEHDQAWQVMGAIKLALDPHNIMNPGKVVRLN